MSSCLKKTMFMSTFVGVTLASSAGDAGAQVVSRLEEIVVTAQRRSESVQSVPISVTALSGDKMLAAGIDGVRDLDVLTPGLNINQRSVVWTPYIRGIGTLDVTAGQEAGVATYVDDVYLASPFGSNLSFNNIERVEVLKGPQGTLFGRNATGGLVHIITTDPSSRTEGRGRVSMGNYDTFEGQFYVGGPLTDRFAADLAISAKDQGEGYGDNMALGEAIPGNDEFGIRNKWVYEAGDFTTFKLNGDYQKQSGYLGNNRATRPGSIFVAGPGIEISSLEGYQDVQQDLMSDAEVEIWGMSVQVLHDLDSASFKSVTAYREVSHNGIFDNDALPFPILHVAENYQVETITQEVQLSSDNDGPINWIVGAFYMDDTNGYVTPGGISLMGLAFPDPFTKNPASINLVHTVDTESVSVFSEVTFDITEFTRLTLGGRYTQDKKEFSGHTEVNLEDGSLLQAISTPESSETWREPTWRIALDHDLGDDVLVYASYNKGFRSGTYNTVQVAAGAVDPEFVDAYEIGFKSELFNRSMRLNGAVFYNDYTDLQLVINQGTTIQALNAGEAEIVGLEIEGEALISDELTIRFGTAYLDTEYKEFPEIACSVRLLSGETGAVLCSPEGNDLIRAPEVTLNLGATYEASLADGLAGISLDYFWSEEFNWEPDGRLVEPSYGRLNGRIYWNSPGDVYKVALWGRNISDEEYSTFTVGQPGFADAYTPAAPRTFGLEVSFNL
jgi:iron complex outermembrane recepter protein